MINYKFGPNPEDFVEFPLDPVNAKYQKAEALERAGKLKEAIVLYKEVVAAMENSTDLLNKGLYMHSLAAALLHASDFDESQKVCGQILELRDVSEWQHFTAHRLRGLALVELHKAKTAQVSTRAAIDLYRKLKEAKTPLPSTMTADPSYIEIEYLEALHLLASLQSNGNAEAIAEAEKLWAEAVSVYRAFPHKARYPNLQNVADRMFTSYNSLLNRLGKSEEAIAIARERMDAADSKAGRAAAADKPTGTAEQAARLNDLGESLRQRLLPAMGHLKDGPRKAALKKDPIKTQVAECEKAYTSALAIAQSLRNWQLLAMVHNNLGSFQEFILGDKKKAEENYLTALQTLDSAVQNRETKYANELRGAVLNNLGLLSVNQGNGLNSRYYMQECLTVVETLFGKNDHRLLGALINTAQACIATMDPEPAMKYTKRARAILSRLPGSAAQLQNCADLDAMAADIIESRNPMIGKVWNNGKGPGPEFFKKKGIPEPAFCKLAREREAKQTAGDKGDSKADVDAPAAATASASAGSASAAAPSHDSALAGLAQAGIGAGAKPQQKACAQCGTTTGKLTRCSRCLSKWYCGVDCQRANWKVHKPICKPKDATVRVDIPLNDVMTRQFTM